MRFGHPTWRNDEPTPPPSEKQKRPTYAEELATLYPDGDFAVRPVKATRYGRQQLRTWTNSVTADKTSSRTVSVIRTSLEQALGVTFDAEKGSHFFRSTLVQTLFYGVFSAWVLWAR
ncbi:hypothetical protein [Bradyrhizobium sp. JYMT SZCCT0180]|uniref:hypothetical protein n=1 Tax=Bradyrhizobium sp. JYMT SZCCT0180 TaxID=2807666 RepID=UPI001BAA6862|nr:hypothetical protein [Bradyrhizobium sp. JYMT SZCCT0180]MBR1213044.1 hypothetical protein [Bradyrhizobium sp. JYMT SZCCT0180]